MKTPLKPNHSDFRGYSFLRLGSAIALFSAATAMAFMSLTSEKTSLVTSSERGRAVAKFRGDRDEIGSNKLALPGPQRERDPLSAADEAYAIRAYPAKYIPLQFTLNAHAAFRNAESRSAAGATAAAAGVGNAWKLAGPSEANDPSILTFSGAPYTTSGRITALAIAPDCSASSCRVWAGAAGGGVWRTDNALAGSNVKWTFISGSFPTNAIGVLTYDAASHTLYAGTGEPNASGDSEAGLGLFKSTDGGDHWTHLAAVTTTTISGTYTGDAFANRAINSVVVDPQNSNILYVGSASAVRGIASVTGAETGIPLPLPGRGVYKSTDGGATFTLLNSDTSGLPFVFRGATDVKIDPSDRNTLYAGQFGQGVFRSKNGGASWTQIFAPVNPNNPSFIERDSIDVAKLGNGHTRMYLGAGDNGTFTALFFRSESVESGTPKFNDLTTLENSGYCRTQCWYDNVVYSPPGSPNTVLLGGAFDYEHYANRSNGRAFIYSTNGGLSFTDMTWDATTNPPPAGSCCQPNPEAPNGMHPDSHALVRVPGTESYIFGSDGGLVRSNGQFADISAQCSERELTSDDFVVCQQLLSRVPKFLFNLNKGLSTLQFQSLSIAPDNANHVQGGTQDNGTFESAGSNVTWPQIIYGDGGQSGFKANNSSIRFNTFTGQANDANFRNGDPSKWVIISAPILSSPEAAYFYPPIIADPNPAMAGSIFQGSFSVWRTQDWGGNRTYLEANCPEFTTSSVQPGCGDFVPIGPANKTDLTSPKYGGRIGGAVGAIERAKSDTGTLWVATGTGRVFISKNANNADPSSVTFTRLDTLDSINPARFVSSIAIDPANPNHAWLSYSGYNANTPNRPGHVFEVTYNPGAGKAVWKNLDGDTGPMGDLPVTDLVRDDANGDLYASTDFGVLRLANGATSWTVAGSGLPMVEVAGLTINSSARVLYAATHGRSAWKLTLP
jgi:hypothetical protein